MYDMDKNVVYAPTKVLKDIVNMPDDLQYVATIADIVDFFTDVEIDKIVKASYKKAKDAFDEKQKKRPSYMRDRFSGWHECEFVSFGYAPHTLVLKLASAYKYMYLLKKDIEIPKDADISKFEEYCKNSRLVDYVHNSNFRISNLERGDNYADVYRNTWDNVTTLPQTDLDRLVKWLDDVI